MVTKEISFSIVMPVYNAEKTVAESVKSVLNQSFKNFELIIVNDNSTDDTRMIIEGCSEKDSRISIVNSKERLGVSCSRNIAIEKAKGKYIAFLDADDLWLRDKLALQYKVMTSGGYDMVYSAYISFGDGMKEKLLIPPERATFKKLLRGNFIGNLTGVYNCHKLGKFYQRNIGHEDYLMWLSIVKVSNKNFGIAKPLAKYRVSSSSLSSNKTKAVLWVWRIYRDHLKLGWIESCYYFFCYACGAIAKRIP